MSGGRARWPARVALGVLLVVAPAPSVSAAQAPGDALLARAYVVRHRPLADAAALVQPLLSPDGSLTLQPRLRTLVVADRAAVLERITTLLESFDLPPRVVEVTLSLFLGTERATVGPRPAGAPRGFSEEVRGVIETLGDFTKWSSYEPLGSRSVTGVEGGEPVVAELSADYRVEFAVEAVESAQRVVSFRRFSLQRRQVAADGSETVENLYTTGMVLPTGKLQVVGAASDPGSKRALFLVLQVRER